MEEKKEIIKKNLFKRKMTNFGMVGKINIDDLSKKYSSKIKNIEGVYLAPNFLKEEQKRSIFIENKTNGKKTENLKKKELDGLYISEQDKALQKNGRIEIIKREMKRENSLNEKIFDKLLNKNIFDNTLDKNCLEKSHIQPILLYFNKNDFFSTTSILTKKLSSSYLILKLNLKNFYLKDWCKFTKTQKLFSDLETKVSEFQKLILSSRLSFLRKTQQIETRKKNVGYLQKLIDEISFIWKEIKILKNTSCQKSFFEEKNKKINKNSEREEILNKFLYNRKKLVVKRFRNIDKQDDFYFSIENNNEFQFNEKIHSILNPLKVFFKVFIDNHFVYKTKSFFVYDIADLNKYLEIFINENSNTIRFDFFEDNFIPILINSYEIDIFDGFNNNSLFSLERTENIFIEKRKLVKKKKIEEIDFLNEKENVVNIEKKDIKNVKKELEMKNKKNDDEKNILIQNENFEEIVELKAQLSLTIQLEISKNIDNIVKKAKKTNKKKIIMNANLNDPRELKDFTNEHFIEYLDIEKKINNYNEDSIRLRLMEYKLTSKLDFKIPLNDEDVTKNLKYYDKLLKELEREKQKIENEDEKSLERKIESKFFEEILDFETIENQKSIYKEIGIYEEKDVLLKEKTEMSIKDYINEFYFNHHKNIISEFLKSLFTQKRKLKPVIKEQKAVFLLKNKNFNLVVNLVKGSFIPLRISDQKKNTNSMNQSQFLKMPNINLEPKRQTNSFINLKFISNDSVQEENTEPLEGPNPSWNAYFESNIQVPENCSFFDLKKKLGEIKITLFDYDPILKNPEVSHKITYFLEKKFLGSLKIKIFDILRKGKIHCQFKLQKPIFIFGYIHQNDFSNLDYLKYIYNEKNIFANTQTNFMNNFSNQMNKDHLNNKEVFSEFQKNNEIFDDILNPFTPVYLDIRLNTDPLISLEDQIDDILKTDLKMFDNVKEGREDGEVLKKINDWIKILKSEKHLRKRLRVFADLLDNTSVLICRYLDKSADVRIFDKNFDLIDEESYKKMAHFVSLISEDKNRNNENLLLTTQEILYNRKCSNEEKMILLANYFVAIDKELGRSEKNNVFLIYGEGLLGEKVYQVGRFLNNHFEIWNPLNTEIVSFSQVF